MAEGVQHSLWEALAMGEESFVRSADTSTFDWKATHPHFGSVIHAVCFGRLGDKDDEGSDKGDEDDDEDQDKDVDGLDAYYDILMAHEEGVHQRLNLLRYAMEQGADPHVVAPETCNFEPSFMHDENAELNTKPIRFSGKTAIECLLAAKRVLTQADPDAWGKGIDDIGRALTILSEARSPPGMAKIPVSEGVVDTWAAVLADAQSADVAIRALAGPEGRERGRAAEGGKVLHAHSVVLRAASPVLAAMLSKGMREGERKEIDLEDCGYREVQVLLSLMYTSSLPGDEEEPSAHTLLEALRLAHRWQARQVVEILEAGLAKALKKETLEPILEEALALGLPRLSQACKVFISNNDQLMRSKLAPRGQGFRSAAVRSEVARVLKCDVSGGGSDGGADKRRRLL